MTLSLVIILIAVGLLTRWPQVAAHRLLPLFTAWLNPIRRFDGSLYVSLALGLPVLLCLLLIAGLGIFPAHHLLQALFALAVLVLSLGPRELGPDLDALRHAQQPAQQLQALTQLHDETVAHLSWERQSIAETVAYAALHRRFGVVFWFVLLGPPGALLYRLSQQLGRDGSLDLKPSQRSRAQSMANAMDWLPAHTLVFTLAVVDHWDAVIQAWRSWHHSSGRVSWYRTAPGFLGAAVSHTAAVADATSSTDVAQAPAELAEHLQRVFARAWISWVVVLALLAVGGWISHHG